MRNDRKYNEQVLRIEEGVSLYLDYKNELIKYDPEWAKETLDESIAVVKQYMTAPGYHWKFVMSEGYTAGFVVFACHGTEHCHPDADYHVVQTYVRPEFRRKHLASKVVSEFIREHPGTYGYDVLNGNRIAELFWGSVLSDIGVSQQILAEVRGSKIEGVLTLHAFCKPADYEKEM